MNAAESAAKAKAKAEESKIQDMFRKAQQYEAEGKQTEFWYDEDASELKIALKRKKSGGIIKKAVKLYTECAKAGHVESMERLAELAPYGKAGYWYQRAAENGSIASMETLIISYENGGYGFVVNENLAKKWRERLLSRIEELYGDAGTKYATAKSNYCLYIADGKLDVKRMNAEDKKLVEEAVAQLLKCAENGHVKSMELLGEIYKDCLHDKKNTFEWYEKGADKGSAICMHALGVMYRDGIGVDPDSYMARRYFDMEKRANNDI